MKKIPHRITALAEKVARAGWPALPGKAGVFGPARAIQPKLSARTEPAEPTCVVGSV